MTIMRRGRLQEKERGSALIIALIVMTITMTLSLAAAGEAIHSASSTALDRNNVEAIAIAEGGIDQALRVLQGSRALPCSVSPAPTLTVPLQTTPVAGKATVTLTYYDSFPPTGSPDASCTAGVQGGAPQAVEVSSTGQIGTSSVGRGTMEALIRLTPYLSDAVYADTLTVNNNITLSGQSGVGDNADIYIAGSPTTTVTCPNNAAIYGSLYVDQGAVSMANNCQVHGQVWANGSVTAANGTLVDGQISSTTSNISFGGSHAGGALAAGTITPACPSPTIFSTCAASAQVGPVPQQNFPQVTYQAAAWSAMGYTAHDDTALTCTAANNDLQTFVPSVKTVFLLPAGCTMSFGNNVTLNAGADMAVFAPGGFLANNSFTWQSTTSATHVLYLIVPYTDPSNCPSGDYDITFKNTATFTNLDAVMYTPCNLTAKNSPVSAGQLYVGGQLNIGTSLNMTFQPETIPGVTQSVAYNAAMAYERQVTS